MSGRPHKKLQPGERFGRLVAQKFLGVTKHGCAVYLCMCDCGRLVSRRRSDLRKGRSTSCEIGECHRRWRGGFLNVGSEAWAQKRLSSLKRQSRSQGYAEPYESVSRVLELWNLSGGSCACCGHESQSTLHLDHCHETGRLRGFVCKTCNTCIGYVQESSSRLISMAVWVGSQPA